MIEPAEKSATPAVVSASFGRRLLCIVYEGLLLIAVLMLAGLLFMLFRDPTTPGAMPFFRIYLVLILGAYFTWFWTHGGQTLAMKTWRFRVEQTDGKPLTPLRAWLRYILAWLSIGGLGVGLLWALVDRDKQFLHDRLAKTRLVMA